MDRGVVRVYLGAAPGVGTTSAMLAEGRRRAERGSDVVVGVVETHGRGRTAALLDGFEHVGREARGLDVDAVLARRPRVVLVDDLAGVGGTLGEDGGRWADVDRLATAGIDVITTLWVGHIESQHDVIERVTGRTQVVSIPDAFLARVDQVELVDMTPEALRRRLAHGNIYAPDEIDSTVLDLFRPATLTALRQLSLLWVAARIDEPLLAYLDADDIVDRWEIRERVVVAVTSAPGNDNVVRQAGRLARRNNGELIGVHITVGGGAAEAHDDRLAAQRDLLVRLGGSYHEVVGDDVASALVLFTRAERATQLVIGASQRSRWTRVRRGSVVDTITRELRDADLHIIATSSTQPAVSMPRVRRQPVSPRREMVAVLLAAIGLPVVVLVGLALDSPLSPHEPLLALLSVVVVSSAVGGARVGLASALAGSLLANWFFTPPRHTLRVANADDIIELVVFVAVAGLIATLVGALGRRTAEADRARAEAEALARSTVTLIGAHDPLAGLLAQVRSTFGLEAVAVLAREGDDWRIEASSGSPVPASPNVGQAVDLRADARLVLVGPPLSAQDLRLLRALSAQLGAALTNRELHAQAAKAELYAEASNLRTAMLQSVSHDLRTPLASIKASVTSLLQPDVRFTDADRRDLMDTINEETDRLDHVVGNLLDMSRLQADAVDPVRVVVDIEDALGAALAAIAAPNDRVVVDLPAALPAACADPVLLERALSNLLANALAWSPDAEPVRVDARESSGRVVIRIADRGPGIPASKRATVFEPFQRLGDRSQQVGVGLGLAVAKGFVHAMLGDLELDDTPGGGLSVFVSLPKAAP